ncbi:tetratricopeptide repeat protein [Actinomadura sp. 7K507]|uniref:tetratricopeptide repeat protein n=1 Tax=Actinomadura sp. 7K507 TaxID=2530365 RepID=UPI0010449E2F|nr:tetratricopeptide repeat protein [Actinomadura sp. 7K507]TDC89809.1 tetratricopeptide repeat protein [Actinomadura sp. 7K507]
MTDPSGKDESGTGESGTDDVFALMAQAQELPYGEARTILVEDALRRAEAAADDVLAFRVRTRLTDSYLYGGEPAKALATFSRTLAEHDRDPGRFDEDHLLLWQMKAGVSSLTLFPEIPLDRTYALLDDMERRYLAGGHSLQAVYRRRHKVAQHVGDGTADDWYLKWRAARRDELSDCEGCDPTGMIRHLAQVGRHEEAFEIAAPVLSSELSCNEQPQSVLTAMLPVYLHTGRAEQAADAHRRAYRVHRARLADLGEIAEHLEFCAATGNEARGLEIVQRHLGWLDRAPSPLAEMWFAAASALVLGRVMAAGYDGATVRRPAADGRAAADVPLPELHAELTERATRLAERFDARNGTSRQGDEVRETLAAEPVVDFLPLAAHHRRPTPAPEPEDLASANDPATVNDLADPREPEETTGDGDATGSLLRLATAHVEQDRPADALAALEQVDPDDVPDRAGEMWFLRGQALLLTGETDDGVAALRRSAEAARASGGTREAAAPMLLLARVLARQEDGPHEDTFALLDELIAAQPAASPMRAAAHSERGLALLAAGRPADAVADLAEAVAGWTAEGRHEQAAQLRVDLAAGYLATGRHLEAAEVAEEALPALGGQDDRERRCLLVLAHAQKELGEEGAVETFTALAQDAANQGDPAGAAHFLEETGEILTGLDKDAQAAERFAAAAEVHEKAGDPYGVVRARRRAAMCLMWSGEGDEAVTVMESARSALASLPPDNEPARIWDTALVSYDQARLLARSGRLPEAASHASAAVDGFSTLDETGPAEEAARLRDDIRAAMQE